MITTIRARPIREREREREREDDDDNTRATDRARLIVYFF
jgi:hypothetical protein